MRRKQIAMVAVLSAAAGCLDAVDGAPKVADAVASELSFQPQIVDTPDADDGKLAVTVQIFRGNDFVQLGAGAGITCNGVALPWGALGYAARVPVVAAGGDLVFVHRRAGAMTQLVVKVPDRPTLTSPADGASLARVGQLEIRYVAAGSSGVRPGASDGRVGLAGSEQSDSGVAYLDVTTLRPGEGTIEISRRVVDTQTRTGFQSAHATYTITSAPIHVTWQ
jgi:hypothetical protein